MCVQMKYVDVIFYVLFFLSDFQHFMKKKMLLQCIPKLLEVQINPPNVEPHMEQVFHETLQPERGFSTCDIVESVAP